MFEEYGDVFSEPTEAEKVIAKAVDDLHDLLSREAMELVKKAAGARKDLEEIERDIRSKKHELASIEKNIEEARKKAEEEDKYEIPRIYITRFVRDAVGDFAPGDEVWAIKSDTELVACPTCKGMSKISVSIDGSTREIKCPDCYSGQKTITHRKVVQRVIRDIRLKLCFDKKSVNYWSMENIYLYGDDFSTAPQNIFKTREEAEEALKKKEEKP